MTVLLPDTPQQGDAAQDTAATEPVLHVHIALENHNWTGYHFHISPLPQSHEELFTMLAHLLNQHYQLLSEKARSIIPPAAHVQIYTTNLRANLGRMHNNPSGILVDFTQFTHMDHPLRVILIPYNPVNPFHHHSPVQVSAAPDQQVPQQNMDMYPPTPQMAQPKYPLQSSTLPTAAPLAQPGGQGDLITSRVLEPTVTVSNMPMTRAADPFVLPSKIDVLSNDFAALWNRDLDAKLPSVQHGFGQGSIGKPDSVDGGRNVSKIDTTGSKDELVSLNVRKGSGKKEMQQQARPTPSPPANTCRPTSAASIPKSTSDRFNTPNTNSQATQARQPSVAAGPAKSATAASPARPSQAPSTKLFDTPEISNILLLGPKGGGKTDVVKLMASYLAGGDLDNVLGVGPIRPTAMHVGKIAQDDVSHQYRVFEVPSFDGIQEQSELQDILSFCSSLLRVSAIIVVVDGSECYRENSAFSKYILAHLVASMLTSFVLDPKQHAIINPTLLAVYTHCEDELSVRLQWKTLGASMPDPVLTIHLDNVFFAPDNNIAVLMHNKKLRPKIYEKWAASEASMAKLLGAILDSVERHDQGLTTAEARSVAVLPAGHPLLQLLQDDVVVKYFKDLSGPYENAAEDTIDRVVASMRPKEPVFGEDGKLTARGRGIQNRAKSRVDKELPPTRLLNLRPTRDLWSTTQRLVMDASMEIVNTYKTGQQLRTMCNSPAAMRQNGTPASTAAELIGCADRVIVLVMTIAVACRRVAEVKPKDLGGSAVELIERTCDQLDATIAEGDARYSQQLTQAINRRAANSGGSESLFTLLCAEIPSEDVLNQAVREGLAILSESATRIQSLTRDKVSAAGKQEFKSVTVAPETSHFPQWQGRGQDVTGPLGSNDDKDNVQVGLGAAKKRDSSWKWSDLFVAW